MSKEYVKINCEYDIDQEYYIFKSESDAIKFVDNAHCDEDYDELDEEGLVDLEWIKVFEHEQ